MNQTPTAQQAPANTPLFYKSPQPLSAATHGAWRIRMGGVGFAAQTQFVPVVATEFIEAGQTYPLLFGANQYLPVALLGLTARNRFVTGDAWQADAYVPAYVRRYPFFLTAKEGGGIELSIDTEAPQVVKSGSEGDPLFQDGKPTPVIEHAWRFCELFSREFVATEAFVKLLAHHKLLVERKLQVNLPGQSPIALTGFYVVDPEAFGALPEALLGDWHRRGILALIYAHLHSLGRIPALAAA